MQPEQHTVTHTINRYRSFRYELILEGVAVGAIAGAVVVAFRYLIGYADTLLNTILDYGKANTWFIPVWFLILAAAAFAVAGLLKWDSLISGSGIPQVEGEIIGEIDECWWRVLIAKLGGGILSLGCGLSLGREGPSIQLGAMAAKGFSRLTRRVKTEEKLLITCGASAGLSAAFNEPIAGILFSLEEVHKHFSPELLLSSMAASITSDFVSRNVFGLKPVFTFTITHMMPLNTYGHVLLLGVLIGTMGVVYNTVLSKTQDLYGKIPWPVVRVLIPFMFAGVFGFLYRGVLGGGHALVEEMSAGDFVLGSLCLLLVVKFCFSMVSFGSGAPGGIFLPLLVLGAIIGSIYYRVIAACAGGEFTAKGKTVKHPGWKALEDAYRAKRKDTEPKKEGAEKALPELTEGQTLAVAAAIVKEGKNSPPQHFTEDTLLSAMETAGKETKRMRHGCLYMDGNISEPHCSVGELLS